MLAPTPRWRWTFRMGTWRPDVLALDPGGSWRMALDTQLVPITADDITGRTERILRPE
jgi:hypothetical protein